MPVHCTDSDILAQLLVFEARFDDAFRYLDRCGEVLSLLRIHHPNWKPQDPNPQSGLLINHQAKLAMSFNTEKFSINRQVDKTIPPLEAETVLAVLAPEAEKIYSIITETLSIPNTTRVGARFSFFAPSDSLEDAEFFTVKGVPCQFNDTVSEICHGDIYSSAYRVRLDDQQTGVRRTIHVASVLQSSEGQPVYTGLKGESITANAGIVIDIDTFTRPSTGHFSDTQRFITNAYHESLGFTRRIFDALSQNTRQQGTSRRKA